MLRLTSIQVVTNDARFSLQGDADRSAQVRRVQCIVTYTQDHMHGCVIAEQGNVDVIAAPWVRIQQPRIPDQLLYYPSWHAALWKPAYVPGRPSPAKFGDVPHGVPSHLVSCDSLACCKAATVACMMPSWSAAPCAQAHVQLHDGSHTRPGSLPAAGTKQSREGET